MKIRNSNLCITSLVATILIGGIASWRCGAVACVAHSGGTVPGKTQGMIMLERFFAAKDRVERMENFGKHQLFSTTNCPDAFSLGGRPVIQLAPNYTGNTCEPWMARFVIVMLDQLLDTRMRALEWGSGSSSQWLLMRVGHLTTIEHDSAWVPLVRAALEMLYGTEFLQNRWDMYSIPRSEAAAPGGSYGNYSSVDFLSVGALFDYVAVDGRSRVDCMKRALHLLKPEGGVLILDNSDRPRYEAAIDLVPEHWPKFEDFTGLKERTTLWVSCHRNNVQHATALRKDDAWHSTVLTNSSIKDTIGSH